MRKMKMCLTGSGRKTSCVRGSEGTLGDSQAGGDVVPSHKLCVALDFCCIAFDAAKLKDSISAPTNSINFRYPLHVNWSQVLSVSSAAGTSASCELEYQVGTSMATPVVAGGAAMVRAALIA